MAQDVVTQAVTAAADRRPIETDVLEVVRAFVGELGSLPPSGDVSAHDALDRDLGVGSLERVELLFRLEQRFGVRFADSVMAEAETPADLAEAIAGARPLAPEPVPEALVIPAAGVPAPAHARTLMEVLDAQAQRVPDRVHVLLREDDGRERPITHAALARDAGAVAAGLAERGVRPGDRVALMLRTEAAFFSAFFGVLGAGAVPVPIYPPFRPDRLEEYAARQVGILANAEPRLLLTFPAAERVADLLRRRVPSLVDVVAVERVAGTAAPPRIARATGDAALIQYTSGSTGEPKGVLLTHANLLANIRAFGHALALRGDDIGVSWLPLYHDMGLIGAWLGALYHGIPMVVLSPLAFLSRPARWLQAIAAHRATVSPAPNFAFDLCVAKIRDEEIEGLDLSTWRLALNGSEAVSSETIERFSRRFERYGFDPRAMCPVYGLAETSVALTTSAPGAGPRIDRVARQSLITTRRAEQAAADDAAAVRVVSCGRPLAGHEVRIVDRAGRVLGERFEGRVLFRGPSVSRGYFRNPGKTRAVLHDGWMDSGDLGYRADGELFVTGRQKDLIIKGGRNLYPQEVEEVAGDVPGIRKGCVAAFGVADPAIGTERLVVVAESRQVDATAHARLAAAVRERVVVALGIPPDTVLIAPPGSVLKTSSGKIRRSATREAYLTGAMARRRPSARAQWIHLLAADTAARGRAVVAGLGRVAFGAWIGLVLLATLPPLWALVHLVPRGRVDRVARAWCRTVMTLAGCRPRVKGLENLPAGAVIFAANHSSYLDAAALLAALPVPFRFVAKRELLATPVVGCVIRRTGHLTVERVDLSRSVADAERVSAALAEGVSLLFFPEGTFLRSPELLPFRLGAFKAAVDGRSPIVPIAIRGTRDVLPADEWLPRPGPITIVIGEPAVPAAAGGWREVVRLREATRAAIERLVAEDASDAG